MSTESPAIHSGFGGHLPETSEAFCQKIFQLHGVKVAFVQKTQMHDLRSVGVILAQIGRNAERFDLTEIELSRRAGETAIQGGVVFGTESRPGLAHAGNVKGN